LSNVGTVNLEVKVTDKGAVVLRQIGQEGEKAGDKGTKSFLGFGRTLGETEQKAESMTGSLMKVGGAVVGIMGVKRGYDALKGSVVEYVGAANVQEAAENKLEAVLQATGHAAGYNIDQLKEMASGFQKVTTVGDEVTLGGMAILSTFKQIKGEAFERATQAALDMSQVMDQDLKSSMLLVGKAANDPITGMTALTRAGVTFTEQQKDQIRTMQESGDMVGAQAIVLGELESQFGGAAAAATNTFGGALTQTQNILGDTKEELGFVITKNQFLVDLVKMAGVEFAGWGAQIKENREYLMSLVKDGVLWLADGLVTAIDVIKFGHQAWAGFKVAANVALEFIGMMLEADLQALRALLAPLDLVFDGLVKLGTLDVNPFDSMESGLATFRLSSHATTLQSIKDFEDVGKGYDAVGDKVHALRDKIAAIPVTSGKTEEEVIEGQKKIQDALKKTAQEQELTGKAAKEAANAAIKAAKEQAAITDKMYGRLKWQADGYYDHLADQYEDDYSAAVDSGVDKELAYQDYMGRIKRLDVEELEHKRQLLDDQYKDLIDNNGRKNTHYETEYLSKMRTLDSEYSADVVASAKGTTTELTKTGGPWDDMQTKWGGSIGKMVTAFGDKDSVDGMGAVYTSASSVLGEVSGLWTGVGTATKGATDKSDSYVTSTGGANYGAIAGGLLDIMGSWIGLGAAESGTEGDDWKSRIASVAGYLGGVALELVGGRLLAENFATGGWLGSHPGGGHIRQGSGFRDDVFLGLTNGGAVANYGMGGEFVIDKETTANNLGFLQWFNGQKRAVFAEGGMIADRDKVRELANDTNAGGFATFIQAWLGDGESLYSAIAKAVVYYGEVIGGGIAGKELGENFADGGLIGRRNFGLGGFFDDLLGGSPLPGLAPTPKEIIDDPMLLVSNDLTELMDKMPKNSKLDTLAHFIWDNDYLVGPGKATIDSVDAALIPFFEDLVTPGRSIHWADHLGKQIEEIYKATISDSPWDMSPLPGFAGGTDYVPYDMPAKIHRGERILTAEENRNYNSRPLQITVMVGSEQFDAYIDQRADNVRVKAERRGLGARPMVM